MMEEQRIRDFLRESNHIEGIEEEPTEDQIEVTRWFLAQEAIQLVDVVALANVHQKDASLRNLAGMDVRVGRYIAPRGGPDIERSLEKLLSTAYKMPPLELHIEFENLHPFMDGNGRTGRVLWLWAMKGEAPLGFLHTFYYQVLDAQAR